MAGLMQSTTGGAPAPLKASWPKTPHDALPLPVGRKVGAVPTATLTAMLVGLGIPGASPESGRAANVAAYAAHLDAIRSAGADQAMARWLAEAKA